jgi:hypothetical protein
MFGCGRVTGTRTIADAAPFVLARVLAPSPGDIVHGLVSIAGTAAARALARYEISVGAGTAPTAWQTAGLTSSGRTTMTGELAVWNTETVADGPWTIRLVVVDTDGTSREARRTVTIDNSTALRALALDVVGGPGGSGSVHALPPRAFCEGAAGGTRRCSYVFRSATTVTLTALPDGRSSFQGWSGACSGTGPCVVSMSQSRSVRATFRRDTVRLTLAMRTAPLVGATPFIFNPPGAFCDFPGCTFEYRPGTSVTVGLAFAQNFWWDPGPCEGRGRSCTLVVNADLTLSGEFRNAPNP